MKSFRLVTAANVIGIFVCLGTAWASTPTVAVSSPVNNTTVGSSVHFAASASSSQCTKGIAAIRIYIAPHISPFTTDSAHLDTTITLSPGNYNTIIQAWDNCGGIARTPVNFTVAATALPPARFLYLVTHSETKRVLGFLVNPQTGALTPTRQGSVHAVPVAFSIASDKGGFRLYVMSLAESSADNKIAAYFIDRRNGSLSLVPGSPSFTGFSGFALAVHPSGKFVYAITDDGDIGIAGILAFRVNSDGSLTLLTSKAIPTQADPSNLVIDSSGKYLYVASQRAIEAFEVDEISGALTPLPGSPFNINSSCVLGVTNSVADDLGRSLYATIENLQIFGFKIEKTTGTLSDISGSPFTDPPFLDPIGKSCDGVITGITTEPTGRFLYAGTLKGTISIFAINAGDGTLRQIKNTPIGFGDYFGAGSLRVDPSGTYLYSIGQTGPIGTIGTRGEVVGFAINHSTGDLTVLPSSPFPISTENPGGVDLIVTP